MFPDKISLFSTVTITFALVDTADHSKPPLSGTWGFPTHHLKVEFLAVLVIFMPMIFISVTQLGKAIRGTLLLLCTFSSCIDKLFDYIHLQVKAFIVLQNIDMRGTKTKPIKKSPTVVIKGFTTLVCFFYCEY